jgi:hypothetical protein
MGLPAWTFMGVGVAAIWFNYVGALMEHYVRARLDLAPNSGGLIAYLPQILVLAIPFGIVVVAALWQKGRFKLSKMRLTGDLERAEGKRGLILLVSRTESAVYAIDYHFRDKCTLETVWLIPSNDSEKVKFGDSSQAQAEAIRKHCEALSHEQQRPLKVEIYSKGVSPADSQDTFDHVRRIFRRSGYDPRELVADFTGGTKPMAVGMIMACLPADRELEYVSFNKVTRQSYGPFVIDYQHSAFDLVG